METKRKEKKNARVKSAEGWEGKDAGRLAIQKTAPEKAFMAEGIGPRTKIKRFEDQR